ncbi:hypothetical protein Scep_009275 [Stephania cephalantha]|uniref:Uncharacterized protein n=1 Tax=Stephania cephalantha TaxID=152367 RepID=A0AAP0JTL9_9MAGN
MFNIPKYPKKLQFHCFTTTIKALSLPPHLQPKGPLSTLSMNAYISETNQFKEPKTI